MCPSYKCIIIYLTVYIVTGHIYKKPTNFQENSEILNANRTKEKPRIFPFKRHEPSKLSKKKFGTFFQNPSSKHRKYLNKEVFKDRKSTYLKSRRAFDMEDLDSETEELEVDEELAKSYHRNAVFLWNYEAHITNSNLEKSNQVGIEHAETMTMLWNRIDNFLKSHTCQINSTITRELQLLHATGEVTLPAEQYHVLQTTTRTMETIYSTATVCDYKDPQNCSLRLECTPINDKMAQTRDPEELQYFWVAWRNATGRHMKQLYVQYAEILNEAAQLNDFPSAAEVWLSAYEEPQIEKLVEFLWDDIKPLYMQLHGYVRRKLNVHYGDEICPQNGPIPSHILGNLWGQSWVNIYSIALPYPEVTPHDLTANLRAKQYTPLKMFKEAENFFKSLTLSPMTRKFWQNSIIERPRNREMVCHASAWDMFDKRDFRIKMCTQVTYEDFIIIHHEMGHIQYYMNYKNQPVVFREGANPGFHEAIGDVIALSVQTPGHLRQIGLLDGALPQNPDKEDINFLFAMALQKIAFIPYALLVDRWRWDVFHEIAWPEGYNAHWWKLTLELQGLKSPVERTEEDFDPGAKYHIAAGVEYLRYFISFIIQFQFHEALCTKAQQYDDKNKPLFKCDIYKSKDAGKLLKKMLRMGLSRPWPEAMKVLTGFSTIDAVSLLNYFKPLEVWLKEDNEKNNVKVGWDL